MAKYDTNKERLPNLDDFASAKNNILRDMYRNAHKYILTDKQIAFANRLWDQEKNGNQVYADNLVELPMLDEFKNARNDILRGMWLKAQRYKLSDKQVAFCRKLWKQEQMPMVELDDETVAFLRDAAERYLPANYYNNTGSYISSLIYNKMEQRDFDSVMAKFTKYRKSVFNKIFV